jgi:competence protein ComGC
MLRKKKITSSKRAASKAKGQSTVEYIILVAAVIAALLIFLPNFKTAVQSTMEEGTNGMQNMAGRLSSSRPLSP